MNNCPEILNAFALPEGERSAVPFGNGHINNTFLIRIAGTGKQYSSTPQLAATPLPPRKR